jgi:DNA-directed RNA polymerase specialized sigma subunit
LISAGNLGLIAAAERYRPRTHGGTPFSAFARLRIHGAIVDSIRRGPYREAKRARAARRVVPEVAVVMAFESGLDRARRLGAVAAAVAALEPQQRIVILRHYRAWRACEWRGA